MGANSDCLLRVVKLMLWMNSGCNARCQMCDIWREKTGHFLSSEQIQAWLPEWKAQGLETVVLCGESLMHPDVWPIVATLKSADIRVEILSNGLLLRKYAQEVVTYCDVLRVSLDGPPDVHNKLRGLEKAYEKLADGMTALRAISPTYPVSGRCAIHQQNFRHLSATVHTAKLLSFSSISFSATDVYNEEAFRRFGRITSDYVGRLVISNDTIEELRDELDDFFINCVADFNSGFITDTPEFLRTQVLGYYLSLIEPSQQRRIHCNAPWTSAVLDYDGTIRPCFPMHGYGKLEEFGGLMSAINSDTAKCLRAGLDVSTHEVCKRCVDQTFNTSHSND